MHLYPTFKVFGDIFVVRTSKTIIVSRKRNCCPSKDAKYCDERVCMYVCLFVRSRVSKHVETSRYFLYMLSGAVARSSSDDTGVLYVLPAFP